MKIFSWNVNGLRAILKKNFGDFLNKYSPDVLCLQETKISSDLCDKIDLPFKYKIFNCAKKKGYSGTAILSNIKPLNMYAINLENHPSEGRISIAEFDEFTIVSAYIPNSKDQLQRLKYRSQSWDSDFREFLKSQKSPLLVCGDLNVAHKEIDLARPDSNHRSAGFTDEERLGFTKHLKEIPLIDIWREKNPNSVEYTWWSYRGGARSKNVGWRIDYTLISPSLKKNIKDVELHQDIIGSDHCPVSIEIK